MNLDIEKADNLYYEIAKDQYLYSDNESSYYKLSVALDRLRNTVNIINKMPALVGTWNEEAVTFVTWINYVDLLIACIDKISESFGNTYKEEACYFTKYHSVAGKTDKDFFRFIRAIVLPHSLSLDVKKQKEFTNNKTAFCPYVVWDSQSAVRIVYYNADMWDDLHMYVIQLSDIENFVLKQYCRIDDLIKSVRIQKLKRKNTIINDLKNEPYNKSMRILEKCEFLENITEKYGDLDDKTGKSTAMIFLRRCKSIFKMKFYGKNAILFQRYSKVVDIALDDYYKWLCEQRTDKSLLDMVLFPRFDYIHKTDFNGLGYEVNKIVAEMENFDSYFEEYYFPEFYEKLRPALMKKAYISKSMNMKRVCAITIMSFFFDKLQFDNEYKDAFGELY